MKQEKENLKALAKEWTERISRAEKKYDDYYKLVKETRESYKAKQKLELSGLRTKGAFNIFWSGIETQKPFLYFKQPKPYIDRVNKISNPAESLACKILEKALEWDLGQFDFDAAAKYARNDYLISGCGILWEQYKPEFKEIIGADGQAAEVKTGEKVVSEYVDPCNFIADPDHVGVWEDVVWIARKQQMSKVQAVETFGDEARFILAEDEGSDYKPKSICVYEIWDKESKRVFWLYKNAARFLRVADDPLGVHGFFPCPKPIFATQTNDSIIPVPDYVMIKADLEELSGVIERMRLTMKALKVSGAYDSSFSRLANILDKDVSLLAVADFDKLKSAGGIRGVIDFMPIEQYITALQALAQRRDDIIKNVYEITGVSDIMRGNSNAAETATAVTRKTNFGTLRNQDRQNDIQRFIRDLYRLKAEIICEQFSVDTLMQFLSPAEKQNTVLAGQAIELLKTEKMRDMVLNVETECVFNQQEESAKTLEAVQTVTKMISEAFQLVSAQPLLLPLYRQMVEAVIAGMPRSRPFEAVLENVFTSIGQELSRPKQPQQPQPTPAERLEAEKIRKEYEIEKEKNALKAREIAIKEQAERAKASLTNKEMDLQANLKAADIAKKKGSVGTGLVKPF